MLGRRRGIPSKLSYLQLLNSAQYSVCDPAFRPGLSEILEDMLPARLLTKSSFTLDLSAKVSNDPFSRLPYDILLMIIDRLPVSRVRSLMGASYHVFTQARSDKFWRSMIRKRFSPCFRELNEFLDKVQSLDGSFDFCKMFWWLDECTRPKYGLTGPLMGLANRRRIWNAVKEIIPLYVERESKAKINGGEDELAKEILDNAKSLHMPVVCFPKPPSVRTTSTQLIRSWNEVNVREWDLEVSFNEAGTLVGLGVKFGEDRRTFGMHQETAHGVSTQSTSMYHLDWIREIVLYTRDVDMFSEPLKRVSSGFSPWKSVFVEAVSVSHQFIDSHCSVDSFCTDKFYTWRLLSLWRSSGKPQSARPATYLGYLHRRFGGGGSFCKSALLIFSLDLFA